MVVSAKGLPTTLPGDSFSYLIGVLTGTETLERLKAVKAAYDIAGWLLGKFFNEAAASAVVKPKKLSKKQLAAALQDLKDNNKISAKALPAWLIPILLELAKKWISGGK